MKFIVLSGRFLFSLIFLNSVTFHFTQGAVGYAASKGVPFPSVMVPLSGIIAILGGLSIVLGYRAKLGAWLIVAFLVPVTVYMHAFWKETDQMMYQSQLTNFMKNLSMLGSALLISHFGSGPASLDKVLFRKKVNSYRPKQSVKVAVKKKEEELVEVY